MVAITIVSGVEVGKLVHMIGYANQDSTELLTRLATIFATGHSVFGSLGFLGLAPRLQHKEVFCLE